MTHAQELRDIAAQIDFLLSANSYSEKLRLAADELEALKAREPMTDEQLINQALAAEREAIYQIVSDAPFKEAHDQDELDSETGEALKAMAFGIMAEIRARSTQAHHNITSKE